MNSGIHPPYGLVVFRDPSAGASFLTRSAIVGRLGDDHPRVAWEDGASYPVVDVDVSSASHPSLRSRSNVMHSMVLWWLL